GGASTIISAPDNVDRWRKSNGCSGTPTEQKLPATGDGTTVTIARSDHCDDGTAVHFATVDGGGHTWPGGPQYASEAAIGKASDAFDASEAIWQFFAAHHR